MGNQFFYKRVMKAIKEGQEDEIFWDSFSLDKVIRGQWVNKGTFIILLDDGHEHPFDTQVKKAGKAGGVETVRSRQWMVSEIPLDPEDAARFREASESHSSYVTAKIPKEGWVPPLPGTVAAMQVG